MSQEREDQGSQALISALAYVTQLKRTLTTLVWGLYDHYESISTVRYGGPGLMSSEVHGKCFLAPLSARFNPFLWKRAGL